MFMFTAKFDRKKAIIAVILIAIVITAIILLASMPGGDVDAEDAAAQVGAVKTNADRIAYLTALGWEVKESAIEEQTILIPREFGGVYEEYNELQVSQGFDLTDYAGMEAVRYTYEITNYPTGEAGVVADIVVFRGQVIAGDIQSTALDGFMHGLSYPG